MSLRWCQPMWWNIMYGEILCMDAILSIYLMPITVRYNMWAIMCGHYYAMGNYCCCCCCCCCFNGLVYNWANKRLCTTCWPIGLILINEKSPCYMGQMSLATLSTTSHMPCHHTCGAILCSICYDDFSCVTTSMTGELSSLYQ
jgi:hypothetical protein